MEELCVIAAEISMFKKMLAKIHFFCFTGPYFSEFSMHFFLLYTIIELIYYHFHVILHERIRFKVQLTLGPIEVCDHPETRTETPCLSLIIKAILDTNDFLPTFRLGNSSWVELKLVEQHLSWAKLLW